MAGLFCNISLFLRYTQLETALEISGLYDKTIILSLLSDLKVPRPGTLSYSPRKINVLLPFSDTYIISTNRPKRKGKPLE